MNSIKMGSFIRDLRKSKQLTQKQLADLIRVSDKTISKWETGAGSPDIAILAHLSEILEVDLSKLLMGELHENTPVMGHLQRGHFHVCSTCGNMTYSTGNAEIFCCGRKLSALAPKPTDVQHRLEITLSDEGTYITSQHPMLKSDYISFVAIVKPDRLQLIKLYPEWQLEIHLYEKIKAPLYFYSTTGGLYIQKEL